MGAKLAQNPQPVHGPGRSLFAGDEQNFAQVRGRFHHIMRLTRLFERESRVEHQAARQSPHEPASHMPSRNLDLRLRIYC